MRPMDRLTEYGDPRGPGDSGDIGDPRGPSDSGDSGDSGDPGEPGEPGDPGDFYLSFFYLSSSLLYTLLISPAFFLSPSLP